MSILEHLSTFASGVAHLGSKWNLFRDGVVNIAQYQDGGWIADVSFFTDPQGLKLYEYFGPYGKELINNKKILQAFKDFEITKNENLLGETVYAEIQKKGTEITTRACRNNMILALGSLIELAVDINNTRQTLLCSEGLRQEKQVKLDQATKYYDAAELLRIELQDYYDKHQTFQFSKYNRAVSNYMKAQNLLDGIVDGIKDMKKQVEADRTKHFTKGVSLGLNVALTGAQLLVNWPAGVARVFGGVAMLAYGGAAYGHYHMYSLTSEELEKLEGLRRGVQGLMDKITLQLETLEQLNALAEQNGQ